MRALVVLALGQAAALAAESRAVVFLTSNVPALDDEAVAQAVAIYTRDLGLSVAARAGAPDQVDADRLRAVIELGRASSAPLVFFYRARPDGEIVLYAVAQKSGRTVVQASHVRGASAAEAPRVLALKVRAILTDAADPDREELPVPPPPAPPPPPVAPARASVAPPKYRARGRVAVGYVADIPLDARLARHGLEAEASLALGRRWELWLAIDVTSPAGRAIAGGSASLFDVPLRAGGRLLVGGDRFWFGAGAFFGVHVEALSATGTSGATGSVVQAAAALGGELLGRARLTEHVAAQIRFRVEGVVPNDHILLQGARVFDAGGLVFGVGAGLAFAVP